MPAIFVRLSTRLLCSGLLATLAACGTDLPVEPTEQDVARAETLRPKDARLAEQYERACLTCHATRSAAPLTGFAPAWKPRLAQGMDVLVAHARDGYKGMPAKGLCSDCSDTDLRGLIAFMSQAQ
ncbi:c-type cytochrome [Aquabacterium sp.]|uniref:c-type cytochrome n=1 Tax=Aquabacterium sp. TaxID=1872578 RepID=UPI002E2F10BF|nr:c-type cytochrome [Aquabacterium sp.]HEX5310852.1 c-type cytochrome [Aquabacterium sp.]